MNVKEAISKLNSLGIKVHKKEGEWVVWDSKNVETRYSDRKLIKKAKALKSGGWGPEGAFNLGRGGIYCSCCSPGPKILKPLCRRIERRKGKKIDFEPEID